MEMYKVVLDSSISVLQNSGPVLLDKESRIPGENRSKFYYSN
jgi:hypothetical protein